VAVGASSNCSLSKVQLPDGFPWNSCEFGGNFSVCANPPRLPDLVGLSLPGTPLGSLPPTLKFSVPSLTNSCPSTPILTDRNLPPAFSLSTEIPDLNLSTAGSNRSPLRSQQVETDPSDPVAAEPATNSSPSLRSQPVEADRPNPVVPAPLRSQPRASDRIPRHATPTQPKGSTPSVGPQPRHNPQLPLRVSLPSYGTARRALVLV
jgi:hypothetical protein